MSQPGNLSTVPLAIGQRLQLFGRVVPLIGFAVMVVVYLVTVDLGIYPQPPVLFFLFIAVVFLFVGYQALQALRDLISGVAVVEEDVLIRSWRGGGRGNYLSGKFERLGTLRVPRSVRAHLAERIKYRVTYSPASKIVWALDKTDLYWTKH